MTTQLRRLLLVAVVGGMCTLAKAQGPGDPGGDPGGSVPIDGGLSLLVAAGVGYAARKRYQNRNNNNQQTNENNTHNK